MPLGVFAAQLAHAANESIDNKLPDDTHVVILAARSERHLLCIEEELKLHNIKHKSIREPWAPWNGQLMSIGLSPVRNREAISKVLGKLPLVRRLKNG